MIRSLEIPDTHQQRITWLERELVGTQLPEVITELTAVGEPGETPSEEAVVLASDPRVLEQGLSWLSPSQLTLLLRNPMVLRNVQHSVLAEDPSYWLQVTPPADDPGRDACAKTADMIERLLVPDRQTPSERSVDLQQRQSNNWYRSAAWAALASIATAAALMMTVNLWYPDAGDTVAMQTPEKNSEDVPGSSVKSTPDSKVAAWGFGKFAGDVAEAERMLQPPLDRRAYLQQLADAAEAWKNKRPEDRAALVRRVGEFRMGCSAILMSEHGPLPEADRQWLYTRCRSWAGAIDRHLASAETSEDIVGVRDQVDATVAKISEALRGRAESLPS